MSDQPSSPQRDSTVDISTAMLLAWICVGAINSAVLAARPLPGGGLSTRAAHLYFDFGHMAALGCVSWAASRAWRRWGPSWSVAGHAAFILVAIAVGYLTLPIDLQSFAARFGEPFELWHNLLIVLVSLGVPAAAIAGRLLARPWLRWAPICAGAGLALANHFVLVAGYPGAHVVLAWGGAVMLSSSALAGACCPRILTTAPWRKSGRIAIAGGLAIIASVSVVLPPAPATMTELLSTNSALLAPFLARARLSLTPVQVIPVPTGFIAEPWAAPRKRQPTIPSTEPRLLPDNEIVLMVSCDAFRADVLSDEKTAGRFTNINALAQHSINFTAARSAGSDTRNSLGSLFTSKYYSQLDWKLTRKNGMVLSQDKTPRFNVLLQQKRGFASLNIASYVHLANKNGFITGFTEETILRKPKGQRWALSKAMTDAALIRIKRQKSGPLLIFMHWMDAHNPYDAAGTEGTERERYLRELELYDKQIGRIWTFLDQRGLLSRTMIVFTSDHGESLGEHNIPHHGGSVYESLVRVPLMIRVPGVRPRRISAPVTHLDIAPTMLDLMGVATPGDYMGQSLVPFFRGEEPKLERPIAADQRVVRAFYSGRYKIMRNRKLGSVELYNLEVDPMESNNLFGLVPAEDEKMLGGLLAFFGVHQINDTWEYPR